MMQAGILQMSGDQGHVPAAECQNFVPDGMFKVSGSPVLFPEPNIETPRQGHGAKSHLGDQGIGVYLPTYLYLPYLSPTFYLTKVPRCLL